MLTSKEEKLPIEIMYMAAGNTITDLLSLRVWTTIILKLIASLESRKGRLA
ncbi:hypothetical protein [Domibacillus aminovorans]|uniref:hypothetical protein n=1 Tax=Domibacillus aminovorans TaxID=29332 RepID=UPI0018DF09E5|nr:hypothetical protein [Domibacillus aminovorans]